MKRILLTFAVLLAPYFAVAQTTVNIVPGTTCNVLTQCQDGLQDGNRVWVNDNPAYPPGSVYVLDSSSNFVVDCQSAINSYVFAWGGNPPSVSNPNVDVPFTLDVQCNAGAVNVHKVGTGAYRNLGGRQGARVRYTTTGGTVSY